MASFSSPEPRHPCLRSNSPPLRLPFTRLVDWGEYQVTNNMIFCLHLSSVQELGSRFLFFFFFSRSLPRSWWIIHAFPLFSCRSRWRCNTAPGIRSPVFEQPDVAFADFWIHHSWSTLISKGVTQWPCCTCMTINLVSWSRRCKKQTSSTVVFDDQTQYLRAPNLVFLARKCDQRGDDLLWMTLLILCLIFWRGLVCRYLLEHTFGFVGSGMGGSDMIVIWWQMCSRRVFWKQKDRWGSDQKSEHVHGLNWWNSCDTTLLCTWAYFLLIQLSRNGETGMHATISRCAATLSRWKGTRQHTATCKKKKKRLQEQATQMIHK